MPAEIIIIRHGQCTGNAADRASIKGDHSLFTPEIRRQKSKDWPLTPKGVRESELAGDWIRKNIAPTFDCYFTSDYMRAIETAKHLNFDGAHWNQDILLREREWGGVENLPYSERNAVFQRTKISTVEDSLEWRPPNGESMLVVLKKVKLFLGKTRETISMKRVLVVSHGAPLQAFRVLQHSVVPSQYISFVNGKNYIRNCHIFHYFDKKGDGPSVPMYSFERSVFLDPSDNWVETIQKI